VCGAKKKKPSARWLAQHRHGSTKFHAPKLVRWDATYAAYLKRWAVCRPNGCGECGGSLSVSCPRKLTYNPAHADTVTANEHALFAVSVDYDALTSAEGSHGE